MSLRTLPTAVLIATLALPARAQDPYLEPYGDPLPCGGFLTRHWVAQPYGHPYGGIEGGHPIGPIPHGASAVDAAPPGGAFDLGDGPILLVIAVVAAAALPVVLYALDRPATPDISQCWLVPSERFDFYGGVVAPVPGSTGFAGVRTSLAVAAIGFEFSAESNGLAYRDLQAALSLRAPPRQHVELALSVGARQLRYDGGGRSWLEVAVPHRYLPFRRGWMEPGPSFEIRPALLWATGVLDARLEASLVIPVGPWLGLQLGARAFSYESRVHVGALGGMHFSL